SLLFGGDGASTPTPPTRGDAFVAAGDGGPTDDVAGGGVVAAADSVEPDTSAPDAAVASDDAEAAEDGATLASADAGEVDTEAPAEDTVAAVVEDTVTAAEDTVTAAEDTAAPAEDTRVEEEDTVAGAAEDTVEPEADTAGAAPSIFVPTDWRKLRCPGGMAKIRRKISVTLASGQKVSDWEVTCIDRYEAPGVGQPPTTDIDFSSAKAACQNAGKRLCSRAEWRRACGSKYPYGKTYDPDACNSVGSDGMPRPVLVTGTKVRCKSGWGTFDMVGNVAEWTSDGTVNGGGAYKHGENGTCYQSSRRAGGHPYVGYRCCADAK
ncbi:MAG: hypothetical protein EP329_06410, partial [Deltaproteobacteria bacterium]